MKTVSTIRHSRTLGWVAGWALSLTLLNAQSVLQFSSTTYNVTEGAAEMTIIVQRTNGLDTTVSADVLTTTNGTATSGIDFVEVSATLTFLANETNKSVSVPIHNDGLVEGIETIQVVLTNVAGDAVLGARRTATVRITDNDKGLSFEFGTYRAVESEPQVLIGVTRGDDGGFPIAVEVSTLDVTAQAGLDYAGLTNTLSFAPGDQVKLLTVPLLNDGLKEANKAFRLVLSDPTGGGVLGSPAVTTVTLIDNDPGVQFTYPWGGAPTSVSYGAHESAGKVEVFITRGNDMILEPFTVRYAAQDLTATNGLDYSVSAGVLEFAPGEMTRVLAIPIANDGVPETPDEQFRVLLSEPNGAIGLGRFATTTVTIWDSTGWAPHGFAGIRSGDGDRMELSLSGGVPVRFRQFLDLCLLDTSQDLKEWLPWSWTVRTNTLPTAPVLSLTASDEPARFLRIRPETLITPREPPTGPYAVGVLNRWVTDPTRRNRYNVSTNSSLWMMVWYPAIQPAGQLPVPFVEEAIVRSAVVGWEDRMIPMSSYAFLNAPLPADGSRFPIVLASHGGDGLRVQTDERAEDLASHGYVVVATDHRDTLGLVFPDGSFHSAPEGVTDAGLRNRLLDLQFLLDQLEAWDRDDAFFAGRLDLTRMAAMGLSWGGVTVADACRLDPRFRAAVLIDSGPAWTPQTLNQGLSVPSLTINAANNTDLGIFAKAVPGSVWLQISSTEHLSFADVAFIYVSYSMVSIWEADRTANAYVLAFLSQHLRAEPATFPLAGYPRAVNVRVK